MTALLNNRVINYENGLRPIAGEDINAIVQAVDSFAAPQPALSLPKLRAALGRAHAGNGNARFLCAGDSTTNGFYSNGTTTGNLKTNSYPGQLSALLKARGYNSNFDSFFASGNGANSQYDTRLVVGTSWGEGIASTVGGSLYFSTAATGNLSFTPTNQFNTFIYYYVTFPGNGTFSFNVNGTASSNVNGNSAASYAKGTATCGLGTNTVNFNWAAGGQVLLAGMEAYNSAQGNVNILNAGWNGSKTTDWYNTGFAFDPVPSAATLAPDCTLISLGINDWTAGTALATSQAALQTFITSAATVGDVILVSPPPSNTSVTPLLTQQNYINMLYALARANNILLIDIWSRFSSWNTMNTNGLSGDNQHPNGSGYSDWANAIYNAITV